MLCVKITIFHHFKEIRFFVKRYLAVSYQQPVVNAFDLLRHTERAYYYANRFPLTKTGVFV